MEYKYMYINNFLTIMQINFCFHYLFHFWNISVSNNIFNKLLLFLGYHNSKIP